MSTCIYNCLLLGGAISFNEKCYCRSGVLVVWQSIIDFEGVAVILL